MRLTRHGWNLNDNVGIGVSTVWFVAAALAILVIARSQLASAQSGSFLEPSDPPTATLEAASDGDAQAALNVGIAYHEGLGTLRNGQKAVHWFNIAMQRGSSDAEAWLGDSMVRGWGTSRDLADGVKLISDAASKGSPVGHRFNGMLYENGTGVSRDYSKAIVEYQQAITMKDANSYDRLGMIYLNGLGVQRSLAKGRGLLVAGALRGDSWAELHLALIYERGRMRALKQSQSIVGKPTDHDFQLASQLLAASATQGNQNATYQLGKLLLSGPSSLQNPQAGVQYIVASAQHRFVPAEVEIAKMLAAGTTWVPQDLAAAYIWFSLAADQHDASAADQMAAVSRQMSNEERSSALARLLKLKGMSSGAQP